MDGPLSEFLTPSDCPAENAEGWEKWFFREFDFLGSPANIEKVKL